MFKKLNMSVKGWMFTLIVFLLGMYFGFISLHYMGIKALEISFLFTDFSIYFKELLMVILILIFYVICSLLPSRMIMMLPNFFMLMSAGQSLVQVYYTLPSLNILGSIVKLIVLIALLGMTYSFTMIGFNVIDNMQDNHDHYLNHWLQNVKTAIVNNWMLVVTSMVVYILFVSFTIITSVIR